MRNGNLLFSAVQFFMIAALFGGGAAFFCLHYMPQMRENFADWVIRPKMSFFLIGALVSGIALLLTICFWAMQKSSYVRIQLKRNPMSIDESCVKQSIEQFWKDEYPEEPLPMEIYCAQQKIEIIAQDTDQDLEQIENRLGDFLAKQFGYEREYFITLTNTIREK